MLLLVVECRDLRVSGAEGVSNAVADAITADVDARLARPETGAFDAPASVISTSAGLLTPMHAVGDLRDDLEEGRS